MFEFNLNSMNEDEKFALLFGIMLGDGCLSHYSCNDGRERSAIVITGNYYNDKPFYNEVLIPLLTPLRGKQVKIKDRSYTGAIEINFGDKILFAKIKSLGFPIGKKGTDILIPKIFYEKDLLKYIVQGFFATDGSLVLTKNPNKLFKSS